MKRPLELRRLRDFGQIINDTFTFLKENFKPLFGPLLVICGFFIVLGTITAVFSSMNKGYILSSDNYEERSRAITYLVSIGVYVFILLISHLCIYMVTFCYISVYVQKKNETPTLAEVWGYFKYYFFRVLGTGILVIILSGIGFMLCLIPGFYLMPIFYLIIPIIVIENASFSYAFNKSFRLIKNNWWKVFGVLFIMGIIDSVAGFFVNLVIQFIETGSRFVTFRSFTLPLLIFFSAIKNILTLVYVLPAIAICLCYFSLSEEKDGTGLMERIERIGSASPDSSILPEEEY